ncbi:MAG: restriction endonuclease [Chloroflexi bacterium]|nr:restriction endonuclease [Chloroflexota bacterium]
MPKPITHNTLFYGDNLRILREHFVDECVDLIYLDPPFNSNRSYNVLFKDESGEEAEAQIRAFEDSWHWGTEAEQTYHELVTRAPDRVSKMIGALREFIGANQMMAYLVMMAARLVELHRVLKPTGSLYLHCDPTASHYLKIVLDSVFSIENFQNEIIWKRTSAHSDSKTFGNTHDVLIACTKTDEFVWNKQYQTYDESYVKSHYRYVDKNGRKYRTDNLTAMGLSGGGYTYAWNGVTKIWRLPESKMKELHELGRLHYTKSGSVEYIRYLDEMPGTPLQDMWDDIPPINAQAAERLGYPTQKPLALLERIINASSNEGDIVLDPFCGCGTAIAAAQKLNRKWIGIDITHLAIALQKNRLQDMFYLKPNKDYKVIGEPEDVASAQLLAHDDRYQFQFWALSLAQARPIGGIEGSKQGKKGSDKGIDGVITFLDDDERKPLRVLIQVKSGHIKSGDIRDLRGTVEREKAAIGIFITLEKPTKEMEKEAVTAGFYRSALSKKEYPRIQILTVEELLDGKEFKLPIFRSTFKQAQREKTREKQGELGL